MGVIVHTNHTPLKSIIGSYAVVISNLYWLISHQFKVTWSNWKIMSVFLSRLLRNPTLSIEIVGLKYFSYFQCSLAYYHPQGIFMESSKAAIPNKIPLVHNRNQCGLVWLVSSSLYFVLWECNPSLIFEFQNNPISKLHVLSMIISCFLRWRLSLKKFQCWTLSLVTGWGRHDLDLA